MYYLNENDHPVFVKHSLEIFFRLLRRALLTNALLFLGSCWFSEFSGNFLENYDNFLEIFWEFPGNYLWEFLGVVDVMHSKIKHNGVIFGGA